MLSPVSGGAQALPVGQFGAEQAGLGLDVCSRAYWPWCVAVAVAAVAGGCFLFCERAGFSVQNK